MIKQKIYYVPFLLLLAPLALLFTGAKVAEDNETADTLPILEIRENALITAIDSIIYFETQCKYYDPNLVYNIGLQNENNDAVNIEIGSLGNQVVKSKAHLGCFNYNNHLFIVSGRSLDQALFTETGASKNIEYHQFKDKIEVRKEPIVLDIMEDDRFGLWIYKHSNGNLALQNRYNTFCN